MSSAPCTKCSAPVPASARFCPRCGHEVGAPPTETGGITPSSGAWPSKTRMPMAGMLFLVFALLGPVLVFAGIYTGHGLVLAAGIVVCVLLVVLLLLGMVF